MERTGDAVRRASIDTRGLSVINRACTTSQSAEPLENMQRPSRLLRAAFIPNCRVSAITKGSGQYHAQEGNGDERSDRRASKGNSAWSIAQGDQDSQRRPEQCDSDCLFTPEKPVRYLVSREKSHRDGNRSQIVSKG